MRSRRKVLAAGGFVVLALAAVGGLLLSHVRSETTPQPAPAHPSADAPPSRLDEVEPNDAPVSAQLLGRLPAEVHGQLAAGDRDDYRLITDEPGGHVLDAWIEDLPGARLDVLDEHGAVRASAVAPGRIGSLGLVRGSTLLAVSGPSGAYRLFVRRSSWTDGLDWEPDDDPAHAQTMRRAETPPRELTFLQASGSWSTPEDIDCFVVPLAVPPAGAALRIELRPPADVQPRLWVLDGGDPSAKIPRRALTETSASAPGQSAILPAVGARSWEKSYVVCSRAEVGAAFGERYHLDVHLFTPDGPIEFEPNETSAAASALPRELPVGGYLSEGDVDWYRVSAGPKTELEARLALPAGVSASMALLDEHERELAQARGEGEVRATATAPAFVRVQSIGRGSVTDRYQLSIRPASHP